jgi:hypothetical protein
MNTALMPDRNDKRHPPRKPGWQKRLIIFLVGVAGAVSINDLGATLGYGWLAVGFAIAGLVAARAWLLTLPSEAPLRWHTRWLCFTLDARAVPQQASLLCFRIAVLVVGQKRQEVREEWHSHLNPRAGCRLSHRERLDACGFLWAAACYRFEDAADLAWRPVDAVLGSRTLSNLFVCSPVIAMLVAIVRHDGWFGLVADVQDPAALGVFLYGVVRTGRWWRGIRLPEPKRRRIQE